MSAFWPRFLGRFAASGTARTASHHPAPVLALQAGASEAPNIASRSLPLLNTPTLLVAHSRWIDPDSNSHRTTYPSPHLHGAWAAQKGQFILREIGPD